MREGGSAWNFATGEFLSSMERESLFGRPVAAPAIDHLRQIMAPCVLRMERTACRGGGGNVQQSLFSRV